MVRRSEINGLLEISIFFEQRGPVWDTIRALHGRLEAAEIPYAVIGGLALWAHNFRVTTEDVDVVMRPDDFERFRALFESKGYDRQDSAPRRFVDPNSEVHVDVLTTGDLAGHARRNRDIRFPDPGVACVGDYPTVPLITLIELKLVTYRYKDWGHVVELIRRNNLDEDFANRLHSTVRAAYAQCYDQAIDPGYEGP